MKLIHLEINKLFGLLDYEIPLDQSEITMLTGPNGYGKTMILKILNAILSNDFKILFGLKFKSIHIRYQGGSITIKHTKNSALDLFHEISNGMESFREKLVNNSKSNAPTFHGFLPTILNGGLRDDDFVSSPVQSDFLKTITSNELISFIRADRLQKESGHETIIDACAERLRTLMEDAQDESATLSQKLDATFPFRLFERLEQPKGFSSPNIQTRLEGIQDMRRNYMRYGLIQAEEELMPAKGTASDSSKEYLGVLELYINDALVKLSPFQVLHQKIALFETIIKEKILAFKQIIVDREKGFYFVSMNGDLIDRNLLSSGEQNQVVLLFNLIFDLFDQKIILIDEPEISLHVAWQQTFLESLKKIQKINEYEKVIIATHSPQIINKNWSLTYDLFEMVNKKNINSGHEESK